MREITSQKKKRGCFYHGCMTIVVINFLCICILIGAGWTFGNEFCKQNLDMTLTETFRTYQGFFRSNDSHVDNAYTASDEQGFYDSIGSALLLNEGAINGEELKSVIVEAMMTVSDDTSTSEPITTSGEGSGEQKDEIDPATEILTEYLLSILDMDNFDQEKINSIGTANQADTNLKISDREIAAFVDGLIITILSEAVLNVDVSEMLEMGVDITEFDIAEYFNVDQLTLHTEEFEIEGTAVEVDMAKLTISIGFESIFDDLLSIDFDKVINSNMEDMTLEDIGLPISGEDLRSFLSGMIKPIIRSLKTTLPKSFYLTVDMGLTHNVMPSIYINNMGFGNNQMANLMKMTKKLGFDLEQMLYDAFVAPEGAVAQTITSINQTIPLSDIIVDGGIDCDAFQLVIDIAKLNYEQTEEGEVLKPEEKQITSNDILKTLKLVLYDNTEYVEDLKDSEYNYKNVSFKRTPSGELDLSSGEPIIENQGKQYYVVDGNELDTLLSDYERLLISRFSNGYGLKDEYDVESIIEIFSGSEFTTETALEMFDTQKIKQIIEGETRGVDITDKMLAALFAKMLPSILEQADMGINAESFGIEYIYLQQKENASIVHHVLNVGLNINVHKLVESMSEEQFVNNLIKNLIRETVIIEVGIDITLGLLQGEYLTTEIAFNGLGIESLEKLLVAFDVLGADEGGNAIMLGDFIGEMLTPIREMITNLGSTLPGLALAESTLKLPDVYVAIAKIVNGEKEETDEGYISPITLQSALRLFVSDGPITDSSSEYYFYREENIVNVAEYNASNEKALLDELGYKYGLTYNIGGREYSLSEILYVLGIGSIEDTSAVDGKELFDFISVEQLKDIVLSDGNWQDSLKVNVTNAPRVENSDESDMLTALVKKAVFGGSVDFSMLGDDFGEDDLLFVRLSQEGEKLYLTIAIKVVIKDMIPSLGDEALDGFIGDLLPTTAAIFNLKVDITEGDQHDESVITINENQAASQAVFELLDSFGTDLDLSVIGDSVRTAFDGIKDVIDVEMTGGSLKLPNIFCVIDEMLFDNLYGDGGQSIKTALKLIVSDGPIADNSSEYYFYRVGNEAQVAEYNASNERALLGEFNDKYAFEYNVGGREYSLSEILYVLGIGSLQDTSAVEGKELFDFISASRLEELAFTDGSWQSSLKAEVTNVTRVENAADSDMLTELIKTVVFNGNIDFSMLGDGFGKDDLLFVKLSKQGSKQYLTLTIKVEIRGILSSFGDGGMQGLITGLLPNTETVISLRVDITKGDLHDESDVVINLDGESTDLMLDFVDRLGASLDLDEIGDSVRSAFDGFRDVIDVEFGQDEMLLPNVFDVINKILLEQMYADGTEIKDVLRSIYLTSETVPLGQTITRKQAYESTLSGVRPNENYDHFLDDLKEKYFIIGEAAEATSFVQLYSHIDVDNFRATNINIKGEDGIAYTTKTIEELTPSIDLKDLGAIFNKNVSAFGDGISIYSLEIVQENLIFNAAVPIKMAIGESDGLSRLISVQEIYVGVVVNITPSNVLTSDTDEKYYHCEIVVNSMDDEQESLFEIAKFFTGSEQDLTDIEYELGKVIYDAISILDDSYGEGNYDIHNDGIVLRDIFTFLKMNIIGESEDVSTEFIKEAIQGMYHRVDGIDNVNNYLLSDIVSNGIAPVESAKTQEEIVMALVMGGSILDKDVGAYVATKVDAEVGEIVQLNIMAPNPTPSSRQKADRSKYTNIIGSELSDEKTYIAMTVIMDFEKFGGENDDDMHANSFVLLDDEVYVTFIFEFVEGTFNYVDFAINNMDKMHKDTLFALTGLDISVVIDNIVSESSDCLAPINDLFTSINAAASMMGRTVEHTFGEADLIDEVAHGTYSCIA